MTPDKTFDCIAMKDAIQAQHAKDYASMSHEERWKTIEARLAASDDIIAQKWRKLSSRQQAATE